MGVGLDFTAAAFTAKDLSSLFKSLFATLPFLSLTVVLVVLVCGAVEDSAGYLPLTASRTSTALVGTSNFTPDLKFEALENTRGLALRIAMTISIRLTPEGRYFSAIAVKESAF